MSITLSTLQTLCRSPCNFKKNENQEILTKLDVLARYRKKTTADPSRPGASSATTGSDGECLESLLRAPGGRNR